MRSGSRLCPRGGQARYALAVPADICPSFHTSLTVDAPCLPLGLSFITSDTDVPGTGRGESIGWSVRAFYAGDVGLFPHRLCEA
jgi:hypothetical protein